MKKALHKIAYIELKNKYGEFCFRCGATKNIEIDHIKPRSKHKDKINCLENVQFLCKKCNASKGNRNEENYRRSIDAYILHKFKRDLIEGLK